MEEILLGRNFRTFAVRGKTWRKKFCKKKIPTLPMNTYVKHVLLLSFKKKELL